VQAGLFFVKFSTLPQWQPNPCRFVMYATAMQLSYERSKNAKAAAITTVICGSILLLFFLVQWQIPVEPPLPLEEGIEVNLGNSETGLGDIPPQIPGDPAPDATEAATPPPTATTTESKIEADPTDNPESPEVNTAVKKPENKVLNNTAVNKPSTKPATTAATTVAAKPKALFKTPGATGTGGNNADSYNGVRNQGIAGGTGDQGKPNGNPNSDSYTGNGGSGNSGVRISSGLKGRSIVQFPSFEDDFNEPARVFVDITVDANGTVTNAVVNPRRTTTTNQQIRSIALRKARQLKLNPGSEPEQTGTIVFDFKLRG